MRTITKETTSIESALAEEFGCDESEIRIQSWDHYGLSVYRVNGKDVAIGADAECDKACQDYIEQTAWAFKPKFILSACGLPIELSEAIGAYCQAECDSANDAMVALIKKTCGMDEFASQAISADGRGHFLSGWDGNEVELSNGMFAYVN